MNSCVLHSQSFSMLIFCILMISFWCFYANCKILFIFLMLHFRVIELWFVIPFAPLRIRWLILNNDLSWFNAGMNSSGDIIILNSIAAFSHYVKLLRKLIPLFYDIFSLYSYYNFFFLPSVIQFVNWECFQYITLGDLSYLSRLQFSTSSSHSFVLSVHHFPQM